jgi:signal transduction histidine kinase
VDCKVGAIHLLEEVLPALDTTPPEPNLRLFVYEGFPDHILAQRELVPPGSGLVGVALEEGKAIIVPDPIKDPRVGVQGFPQKLMGPYAFVPLRAGGRTAGVLTVGRDETAPQFTAEEVALFASIGNQVGVVVESTRLREQAQQTAVLRERERLARELHDSITQSLYSLTLFADWACRLGDAGDMDGVQERLERIGTTSHQALKEMRLLLYELRPSLLEQDGLEGALERRLDAVERRAGTQVEFSASIHRLPPAVELDLYRITEEALNNALKHAQANTLTVRIEQDNGQVTLTVSDDGVGFDPEAALDKGGMGLRSIQQRVEQLGATLDLTSAPGSGTRIEVCVEVSK